MITKKDIEELYEEVERAYQKYEGGYVLDRKIWEEIEPMIKKEYNYTIIKWKNGLLEIHFSRK